MAGLAILGASALALPTILGVQDVDGEPPRSRPTSAADLEARWDGILSGTVENGVVDYAELSRRRDALARFVGALATFGPRTAPTAFENAPAARFAYYINAYNAFVIYAVLERDVRVSVRDVQGTFPTAGLGFFWAQRFELDGEHTNLHALENDVLRQQFSDARVHAALNCASRSCPDMVARAYHADRLDAELAEAAHAFAEAPHVVVDEAQREVRLSSIYDWYAGDFIEHARNLDRPPDVLSWISQHARHPNPVERARREAWPVRHVPYDWRLNGRW